ncbi:MAG: TIGR00159 family protein [Lachnospiraceae bacterium]|nr:TIGR00159 family protein [Lachnospiraceae bacterium]
MTIVDSIGTFFSEYVQYLRVGVSDVIEIIIIAFLLYEIIIWFKKTRAWVLFKGIAVILIFILIAMLFNLNTIVWIASKALSVGVIALFIVFQPELRRALEQLGRRNFFASLFTTQDSSQGIGNFTDKTLNDIVKACNEMSRFKTGALIVIEQKNDLDEYIRTGITMDAVVSSQLLINTFEKNTPLHDGAVIIRGDRIISATCYLPLSDNMELSKELGTRHRAAVGLSEASDAFIIIVSEETGAISVAVGGAIFRNLDSEGLRNKLTYIQKKGIDVKKFKFWKGKKKNEKDTAK